MSSFVNLYSTNGITSAVSLSRLVWMNTTLYKKGNKTFVWMNTLLFRKIKKLVWMNSPLYYEKKNISLDKHSAILGK